MNIPLNITPSELQQALRLSNPGNYWVTMLRRYWYATALFIVIGGLDISRLLKREHNDPASWYILIIPIAFFALRITRVRSAMAKGAERLSEMDGTVDLAADGLRVTTATGATSFTPWRDFSAWSEGSAIFMLKTAKAFRVLPKKGLSEIELEQARGILRNNIFDGRR